jgi:hypothetical protein
MLSFVCVGILSSCWFARGYSSLGLQLMAGSFTSDRTDSFFSLFIFSCSLNFSCMADLNSFRPISTSAFSRSTTI